MTDPIKVCLPLVVALVGLLTLVPGAYAADNQWEPTDQDNTHQYTHREVTVTIVEMPPADVIEKCREYYPNGKVRRNRGGHPACYDYRTQTMYVPHIPRDCHACGIGKFHLWGAELWHHLGGHH